MGKATGFLEYERVENPGQEPLERIKTYREFHTPLDMEEPAEAGSTLYGLWRSFLPERQADYGHGVWLPLE